MLRTPRGPASLARLTLTLALALAVRAPTRSAHAQVPGIRAGITNYDLVGTGTEPMVSVSRSWRLDRRFYLAAALPTFFAVRSAVWAGSRCQTTLRCCFPS